MKLNKNLLLLNLALLSCIITGRGSIQGTGMFN